MPTTIQEFFADATRRAAQDLIDAARLLPEDKRGWQPLGKGRSALDQIAECAMINQNTVEMIKTHQSSVQDVDAWMRAKSALAERWDEAGTLLQISAADVSDAILTVTDAQLPLEIALPWGPFRLSQLITYPYWNMSYHQGQITYIHALSE